MGASSGEIISAHVDVIVIVPLDSFTMEIFSDLLVKRLIEYVKTVHVNTHISARIYV